MNNVNNSTFPALPQLKPFDLMPEEDQANYADYLAPSYFPTADNFNWNATDMSIQNLAINRFTTDKN